MSRPSSNATHAERRPVSRADDETTEGGEPTFDWAALVPVVFHPLKVAIIEALAWIGSPLSASDLQKVFGGRFPLGNISYHLKELARIGALRRAGKRPVRGTVERFYFFSDEMLVPAPAQREAA